MEKRIEDAAKEFMDDSCVTSENFCKEDISDAFECGANYVMELPLRDRLTDEERKKIIGMYDAAVNNAIEIEDQRSPDWDYWVSRLWLLTRIFGKELFDNREEI